MDSNGDGVGDLRGIISKLDYLKDLGIDIIWLSPIYCSPFVDQGYDISDYYNIDPRFGTMEDFDQLLVEAKKRNMYLVMDLVVNHCSDQHEWFQKALADPEGPYAEYFYFREGKAGNPPCNWRSYFGGSAWEKVPGTVNKYYLHMFAKEQPDLNWENPFLRKEIYKMINWWLEKGLAGFRIDAIINIKKDLRFEDFPTTREDGLSDPGLMLEAAQGVGDFLMEMKRETFDQYDAFTVGEVFNQKDEELPLFIGDDGYFSSMFDFETTITGKSANGWYDSVPMTPNAYRDACFRSQEKVTEWGFLSNIIENHDEPRGASYYIPEGDVSPASIKMLGALSFLLRGLPFIYQGQEIGMTNTIFESLDQINDISTLDEYEVTIKVGYSPEEALQIVGHYSRDNARTPFHWDDTDYAGFTTGTPWLKVNPNYKETNVKAQLGEEDSILKFYKKLIALRKDPEYKETIVYGTCEPYLKDQDNLMAYYRRSQEQTLLVIGNYQRAERTIQLPSAVKKILLNNSAEAQMEENRLTLKGYQVLVLDLNI